MDEHHYLPTYLLGSFWGSLLEILVSLILPKIEVSWFFRDAAQWWWLVPKTTGDDDDDIQGVTPGWIRSAGVHFLLRGKLHMMVTWVVTSILWWPVPHGMISEELAPSRMTHTVAKWAHLGRFLSSVSPSCRMVGVVLALQPWNSLLRIMVSVSPLVCSVLY